MSVILEHDTAQKARRAVVVTSVVLILLHYVDLGSSEMEIFKLKISVQKDNVSLFLKLTLAYLLYIYIAYEVGGYWAQRTKRMTKRLMLKVEADVRAAEGYFDDGFARDSPTKKMLQDERIKEYEAKLNEQENSQLLSLSNTLKVAIDYLPVMAFSLLAFSGAHESLIDSYIKQSPQGAVAEAEAPSAPQDTASGSAAAEGEQGGRSEAQDTPSAIPAQNDG